MRVEKAISGLVQTVAYKRPPTSSLYVPEKFGSLSAAINLSWAFVSIGAVGENLLGLVERI